MDVGDELDLAFEEEFNHKDIDYLDRLDEKEVEDFVEIFEPEELKLDGVGLVEEKVHILWLVYSSKYIFLVLACTKMSVPLDFKRER